MRFLQAAKDTKHRMGPAADQITIVHFNDVYNVEDPHKGKEEEEEKTKEREKSAGDGDPDAAADASATSATAAAAAAAKGATDAEAATPENAPESTAGPGAARFVAAVKTYDHLSPMVLFSGDCFAPSFSEFTSQSMSLMPSEENEDLR